MQIIAAIGMSTGIIGINNDLAFKIPEDMQFFRFTTQGSTVIMGRATFESLPRPLKGRVNIVVSSTREKGTLQVDDTTSVIGVGSFEEATEQALLTERPVFIIGGRSAYEYYLNSEHLTGAIITWVSEEYHEVQVENTSAIYFPTNNTDRLKFVRRAYSTQGTPGINFSYYTVEPAEKSL